MLNDCLSDSGYLRSVIGGHVAGLSVEEQLEALSGNYDCCAELLGFDPRTGKPHLDKESIEQ